MLSHVPCRPGLPRGRCDQTASGITSDSEPDRTANLRTRACRSRQPRSRLLAGSTFQREPLTRASVAQPTSYYHVSRRNPPAREQITKHNLAGRAPACNRSRSMQQEPPHSFSPVSEHNLHSNLPGKERCPNLQHEPWAGLPSQIKSIQVESSRVEPSQSSAGTVPAGSPRSCPHSNSD